MAIANILTSSYSKATLVSGVLHEGALPGFLVHILEKQADGTLVFRAVNSDNASVSCAIVLEDVAAGQVIDFQLDQGTRITVAYVPSGETFYAYLTASQTVVVGDLLSSSAAAGRLQKYPGGAPAAPNCIVAVALEDVTTGVGEYRTIKVSAF